MPALLYHVEKSCGIIEDRTLKAKLASDPSNIKFSAFDSTKIDDDLVDVGEQQMVNEGDGFVHDKRFDPMSAAPNTVPEVVVQMLVSFLLRYLTYRSLTTKLCCAAKWFRAKQECSSRCKAENRFVAHSRETTKFQSGRRLLSYSICHR